MSGWMDIIIVDLLQKYTMKGTAGALQFVKDVNNLPDESSKRRTIFCVW